MNYFFSILLFLFITISGFAQSTLKGRVVDAETGEGIDKVNIFISNTTIGTSSDNQGYFIMKNIPAGNFEVVLSHISYEISIQIVSFSSAETIEVAYAMNQSSIELAGVEVSVDRKKDRKWENNLKRFRAVLLGETSNAVKCSITNPWVLEFEEKFDGSFYATAKDLILIENKALGYLLTCHLELFQVINGEPRYMVRTKYDFLEPEKSNDKKRWNKERLKAYYGSLPHFIHSLVRDELKEEGFQVSIFNSLPETYDQKGSKTDMSELVIRRGNKYNLMFPGYLQVIYTKEMESRKYLQFLNETDPQKVNSFLQENTESRPQTSWLAMLKNCPITSSGELVNPLAVQVIGYWGWQRLADELPKNFRLP